MKNPQPFPVRFFHSSPGGLLPFDEKSLAECIPLERPGLTITPSSPITYETYLQGIERFITENREGLTQAVSHQMSCPGRSIAVVDVVTEKHGSDYHPARLLVRFEDSVHAFVVNTAVTERGMSRLNNEFHVLQYLHARYRREFVPRMYVLAKLTVTDQSGGEFPMAMVLGEWFDGFHEFHLSEKAGTSVPGTVLWDMNEGYVFLDDREAQEIYRRAAFILTYYYDCETFREIYPWHHAAGDFVVSRSQDTIDVRLITARQYARRLTGVDSRQVNRMEALSAFVANLTIRMRLDRLDGVGDIAWAGDHCVDAAIRGVVDALEAKVADGSCDAALPAEFLAYSRSMSPADWAELLSRTSESYDQDAPDVPVVREHMTDHIFRVYKVVQSIG